MQSGDCNGTITIFRECGWKRQLSFDVPRRIHQHCTKKPRRARTAPRADVRRERARHGRSTRGSHALIGRPATNLQRCGATPGTPATPPGGARLGLKTLPDRTPPAPPPDIGRRRKAEAHTRASLLLAAKGDSPHAREGLRSDCRLRITHFTPPHSLHSDVQHLQAPQSVAHLRLVRPEG